MIMDEWENSQNFRKCFEELTCLLLSEFKDSITCHFSLYKTFTANLTFRCSKQLIQILSRTISLLISSSPLGTLLFPERSQVEAGFSHLFLYLRLIGWWGEQEVCVFLTVKMVSPLKTTSLSSYFTESQSYSLKILAVWLTVQIVLVLLLQWPDLWVPSSFLNDLILHLPSVTQLLGYPLRPVTNNACNPSMLGPFPSDHCLASVSFLSSSVLLERGLQQSLTTKNL